MAIEFRIRHGVNGSVSF